MTITVPVEIAAGENGVLARATTLHLAGQGRNDQRALETLTAAVLAWAHGLASTGSLADALDRGGTQWRPEADDIAVEYVPTPMER